MVYAFSKTKRMLNSYTTSTESNLLNSRIEKTTSQNPHPGLIIASHHFIEGGILIDETDQLSCSTMVLLIKFAYPSISGYAKFTISFTMRKKNKEKNKERISFTLGKESISFTLGPAIPLTYEDGSLIPKNEVYANIVNLITQYKEIYEGEYIENITIRVYFEEINKNPHIPSEEEVESILASIFLFQSGLSDIEPIKGKKIQHSKKSYPSHITAIKSCRKNLKCFLVGDIETIVIDNVHKPYAAGLMMVRPNEVINQNVLIETFFSEDDKIIIDSFDDRSTKVLNDLIIRILSIVRRKRSALTIYFHNFSRFDGILLLKHIACHHKYELKPLLRNNRLYELGVYSGKKMLFRFRDSLNLLPGSLNSLASSLCPELGTKGSIDHENVTLSNLASNKKTLLDYMKQDILLLGGVMRKAQDIYWKLFQVDIESKITLSSLALTIFRMKYYDEKNRPIHIPNKNEDNFIRRAYYGGHTDVYIPYGENLYYYDVNSLYPFVMKEFPMPGGVPVWHRNLEDKDLNSLFGFIEAYVVCPKTIKRPFLPYRDKNKTLIFPTGEFIGVYYSEELKYARDLGYTVIPISGYLFEKMESPFKDFVSTLYESRLKARNEKNEALAYVYKILMNSLYGRFGINPKSTITEVCNYVKYKHFLKKENFIFGEMLRDDVYIVAYHRNMETTSNDQEKWDPPRNSAVQLAAAITACARINMYPYTSREDCYYTDTDSVVLGQPLHKDDIDSKVLGKFKLEDRILKGYFLAPKSYSYIPMDGNYTPMDGNKVTKYKGPGKQMVTPEWFELQYADPSREVNVSITSNFRIDWHTLNILRKESMVSLTIKQGGKRIPIYDKDNIWKDTEPIDIKDLSSLDYMGKLIVNSLRKQISLLQNEKNILISKLSKEGEKDETLKEGRR